MKTVSTDITLDCLRLLQRAAEPMTAAEIAERLGLDGNRETQRRRVRAIVKVLRDGGHWIIATLAGGYWLTKDEQIWRDYNEHRTVDAKRVLAEAHKQRRMLTDAHGQGMLFNLAVQPAGGWS